MLHSSLTVAVSMITSCIFVKVSIIMLMKFKLEINPQVTPGLVALKDVAGPSFLAGEACFRKYCCVHTN